MPVAVNLKATTTSALFRRPKGELLPNGRANPLAKPAWSAQANVGKPQSGHRPPGRVRRTVCRESQSRASNPLWLGAGSFQMELNSAPARLHPEKPKVFVNSSRRSCRVAMVDRPERIRRPSMLVSQRTVYRCRANLCWLTEA